MSAPWPLITTVEGYWQFTLIFKSRESFARTRTVPSGQHFQLILGRYLEMKARLVSALIALGSLAVIAGAGVAPFQHW